MPPKATASGGLLLLRKAEKYSFVAPVAESENSAADYPYARWNARDTIILESVYHKGIGDINCGLRLRCLPVCLLFVFPEITDIIDRKLVWDAQMICPFFPTEV